MHILNKGKGMSKKLTPCMIAVLALAITMQLRACPTCIGRLEKHTPPFFSDEYYEEINKKIRSTEPIAYEHDQEDEDEDNQLLEGVSS